MSVSPTMKFYPCQRTSAVIIHMDYTTSFSFTGVFQVTAIWGCVDVLGYKIKPESGECIVYSPSGSSSLPFRAIDALEDESGWKMRAKVALREIADDEIKRSVLNFIKVSDCVFIMSRYKGKDKLIRMTREYMPNTVVFPSFKWKKGGMTSVRNILRCEINGKSPQIIVPEDWKEALSFDNDGNPSRILICGGNGVGKSTLLRYAVNVYLNSNPKILVIDLDPGQCEFTINGCVSATVVDFPLLGPNFTHLATPDKCIFYGYKSVDGRVFDYLRCVQTILEYCKKEHSDVPWIINTMGYTKGIGVNIIYSIIHLVEPTDVIQISSQRRDVNFPKELLPGSINPDSPTFEEFTRESSHRIRYNHRNVASVAENSETSFTTKPMGLDAKLKRRAALIAYFSEALNENDYTLWSITPWMVSMKDVTTHFLDETDDHKRLLDGQLVALGCWEGDKFCCRGFGAIRYAPKELEEDDRIYIVTPLKEEHLSSVKAIVASKGIHLDDIFFTHQAYTPTAVRQIPYLATWKRGPNLQDPCKSTFRARTVRTFPSSVWPKK